MDKNANKNKASKEKGRLMMSKQQANRIKIIVTVVVLLIAALTYYIIDSGSYVATVDGNRISNAEYQFFLSQQKYTTEVKEGLTTKTAAEKKAFWTKTVDGQNPWETAKNEALNASKEYMIQIIKANQMGLKVDSTIKEEVNNLMTSSKGSYTDQQFEQKIKESYNISTDELRKISENLMLIDRFRTEYINKNYTAAAPSDTDVKAYYDKDPKVFDKVDISYISLSKVDASGNALPADQLNPKLKKADEALAKIQSGEDMTKLISEYSEEKASTTTPADQVGKATIGYSTNSLVQNLIDYVFSAKPGDAKIIDTQYVIYVVKVDKRTGFEEAKATVKTTIENNNKDKFYDDALHSWSVESRYNIIKNNRIYDSISYK